jgi:tripartite-type tricarboxylate transporter receptor subunit TctC
MQHVPYRGAAAAKNDLLAGRIQFLVDNAASIVNQVEAKKFKALAVTGEKRWPRMPQLPTYSEYFKRDVSLEAWFGIFARSGTPKAILDKLAAALDKEMQDKKTLSRFASIGYVKNERDPAASAAYVAKEMKRWPAFLRQAKIRIN